MLFIVAFDKPSMLLTGFETLDALSQRLNGLLELGILTLKPLDLIGPSSVDRWDLRSADGGFRRIFDWVSCSGFSGGSLGQNDGANRVRACPEYFLAHPHHLLTLTCNPRQRCQ